MGVKTVDSGQWLMVPVGWKMLQGLGKRELGWPSLNGPNRTNGTNETKSNRIKPNQTCRKASGGHYISREKAKMAQMVMGVDFARIRGSSLAFRKSRPIKPNQTKSNLPGQEIMIMVTIMISRGNGQSNPVRPFGRWLGKNHDYSHGDAYVKANFWLAWAAFSNHHFAS